MTGIEAAESQIHLYGRRIRASTKKSSTYRG
jgi:hypothetical protein